jgi:hypothetical protein
VDEAGPHLEVICSHHSIRVAGFLSSRPHPFLRRRATVMMARALKEIAGLDRRRFPAASSG